MLDTVPTPGELHQQATTLYSRAEEVCRYSKQCVSAWHNARRHRERLEQALEKAQQDENARRNDAEVSVAETETLHAQAVALQQRAAALEQAEKLKLREERQKVVTAFRPCEIEGLADAFDEDTTGKALLDDIGREECTEAQMRHVHSTLFKGLTGFDDAQTKQLMSRIKLCRDTAGKSEEIETREQIGNEKQRSETDTENHHVHWVTGAPSWEEAALSAVQSLARANASPSITRKIHKPYKDTSGRPIPPGLYSAQTSLETPTSDTLTVDTAPHSDGRKRQAESSLTSQPAPLKRRRRKPLRYGGMISFSDIE